MKGSERGDRALAEKPLLRIEVAMRLGVVALELDLASRARAIAVVGPSGSGKSTLLRIVAGVEHRAAGRVEFAGESWLDSEQGAWLPPWSRPVGWVPQDGLLFPNRSVLGNLLFGAGPGADAEVGRVSSLLRIDHLTNRVPSRLSGGERQRVALGRALLASPRLLLLDEPFSALDRTLRTEIREAVADWARGRDASVILVSHDEEDACSLAEERYALTGGRLVREG